MKSPATAGFSGPLFLPDTADVICSRLADWKRAQGIATEVRTTGQTGTAATDIQGYIQNAYDTWSAPPAYVLPVGDVEFIPTHPGDGCGTDLYCATVGTDLVACAPPLEAGDAVLVVVTKPNFRPFVAVTVEDGDTLPPLPEIRIGTSPHDADSDDDGIADDAEVNEEATDPRSLDTGGDGIQDGTEPGYTLDDIHADTDTDIFQADEDPSTTTDPLDSGTDGDCAFDGQEDTNANGRVDDGETDPTVYNNLLPPVANAGADQSVREGATVRLDGTGSYDACQTALLLFREQVSGPTVNVAGAILSFRLTVDDGFNLTATDTCQVTVTDTPPPPEDDDDSDDDDDSSLAGGGGGGGGCFIGAALSLK